jgi:hypothetical protein
MTQCVICCELLSNEEQLADFFKKINELNLSFRSTTTITSAHETI